MVAPRREPYRVLIVDDNRDAVEVMSKMLRLQGSDVHVVYDGFKALSEARTFRPDAVFSILGFPR